MAIKREINHGTHHAYINRKCRCDICRMGENNRKKKHRAKIGKEECKLRYRRSIVKSGLSTIKRSREWMWKNKNIKINGNDVKWEDFIKIYDEQNCRCYICNRELIPHSPKMVIVDRKKICEVACLDHNHITGEVRGILCQDCNALLGYAKDNIDILKKSIIYLQKQIGANNV